MIARFINSKAFDALVFIATMAMLIGPFFTLYH